MWIRLTLLDDRPIMMNMDTYGNFLSDMKNPSSTILYQTDVPDDSGIAVRESFKEIARIVNERQRGEL